MSRIYSLVVLMALGCTNLLTAATGPSDGTTPPPQATSGASTVAPPADVAGGATTTPPATAHGSDMWSLLLPLIILVAFMYFVMLRPQKKEQQKRQSMLNELKVGEKVVTIGGMHGTIVRRGEADVDLEVANGVTMTFNVGAIHERVADQATKKE